MNGGLHLLDPHAHMHRPRRAVEVCKWQRISWAAHTACLMLPRGGGSLGWRCSSSNASSSLPPRLPATLQCSCLYASPLCWLWGGEHLCASIVAAEAPLTAVLQRVLVPELPLAWVFDAFTFCSFFFSLCINLVSFNLIASFSDRLSQEQCKWALKCGDLVYICQLIAWVAQTSRAGTCLLAFRSTFDFRPDAACRRWAPDGGGGCALRAISCFRWQWPKFFGLGPFYTASTDHRGCALMQPSVDLFTSRRAGPVST